MAADFGYEIKITRSGSDDIILATLGDGNNLIDKVAFRKKSLDNTGNRGNVKYCEFEITGVLNKETKNVLKQVADWALDMNKDTIYRQVDIVIAEGDNEDSINNKYRTYQFENMCVLDYEELFDKNQEMGEDGFFTLLLGQKPEKSIQSVLA